MECGHATQATAINEGMQGRAGAAAEAAAQIRFDDGAGVSRGETNRTEQYRDGELRRVGTGRDLHAPQLHPCLLSRTGRVFIDYICANAGFFLFLVFFPRFMGRRSGGLATLPCESVKSDALDFTQVCACEGKQPAHVITGT